MYYKDTPYRINTVSLNQKNYSIISTSICQIFRFGTEFEITKTQFV